MELPPPTPAMARERGRTQGRAITGVNQFLENNGGICLSSNSFFFYGPETCTLLECNEAGRAHMECITVIAYAHKNVSLINISLVRLIIL